MPGLEAVRVLCSILIITYEHMYFPEVFCSFVCFVALCVGGVGGQWTDETALCGGQRTNQVSVPSSLARVFAVCLCSAYRRLMDQPAFGSLLCLPPSLCGSTDFRCALPHPDLVRFQRFKLRSLHLKPQALYFLSHLPSHPFVM